MYQMRLLQAASEVSCGARRCTRQPHRPPPAPTHTPNRSSPRGFAPRDMLLSKEMCSNTHHTTPTQTTPTNTYLNHSPPRDFAPPPRTEERVCQSTGTKRKTTSSSVVLLFFLWIHPPIHPSINLTCWQSISQFGGGPPVRSLGNWLLFNTRVSSQVSGCNN